MDSLSRISISLCSILVFLVALPSLVMPKTLDSDTRALLFIKESIDPSTILPSTFISTWDFSHDPCENMEGFFQGILCEVSDDDAWPSRVTTVHLDPAGYDGFLAPSIGNLTALVKVNLTSNNLRGPIPESITQLRNLTVLALSENSFTGTLPEGLVNMRKLEVLDVSNNVLMGTIPHGLTGLRQLTHLGLSGNQFYGSIPDLSGLWQLTSLDLSHNQFQGSVPSLPRNIRVLSLARNVLSGRFPSTLRLPHLQIMDLSRNRFTGVLSHWLFELPCIRHIDVSTNGLTTLEVYNFTGKTITLESLNASWNNIRTSLPKLLVTVDGLTEIDLSHNRLRGKIPVQYGLKAMAWRKLFLNDNYLVGDVPDAFGKVDASRLRGSLSMNCLRCPPGLSLCGGVQRSASECRRQNVAEKQALATLKS